MALPLPIVSHFCKQGASLCGTVLLLLCFPCLSLQSQEVQFQKIAIDINRPLVHHYLEVKENNLSINSVVLSFFQSSDQTVWIGTESDGLIAYQGRFLKHYRHEPGNPSSLPSNAIYDVWEEDPAILWISTGSGLVKFNRLAGSFTQMSTNGIFVRKGPNGKLYTTVPGQGLNSIDTTSHQLNHFPRQQIYRQDGTAYPNETMAFIHRFTIDNEGALWAVAKTKTLQGLFRFEEKGSHWLFYPPPSLYLPEDEKGQGSKEDLYQGIDLQSIYIDQNDQIWCGGWAGRGLLCYHQKSGKWRQYYFNASSQSRDYNRVLDIHPLTKDEFWIGAPSNGFVFNHRQPSAYHYTWLHGQKNGVLFQSTHTGFVDHGGNHWLSTEKGIYKFNSQQTGFRHHGQLPVPNGDRLSAFYQTAPGNYLLSVLHTEAKTGNSQSSILEIRNDTVRRLPFSINGIVHEFVPAGAGLFYLMGIQVHLLNVKKGRVEPINIRSDEPGGWNRYLEFFRTVRWNDSVLYTCARTIPEGLIKINIPKRQAVHLKTASGTLSPKAPQNNGILRILRDSYNRIWCSTMGGVDIFHPEKETFAHYTLGEGAIALAVRQSPRICESPDRTFYIASEAGIFATKAIPGTEPIFRFITTVGVCYWILADKTNHLWVGTPQGVFRVEPATKTTMLFTEKKGYYWNPLSQPFVMPDGRFVMHNGMVIDPSAITWNSFKPLPFVTKFLVSGQPFPLDTAIGFKKHIQLKNDQNFFSISFSSNNYIDEENNQFRYRLQGIDKKWVNAGNNTEANYTALPPGRYHLYVQAANNDGLWGDPKEVLAISILPAWHQTAWFKALAALIICLVTYAIYRQHLVQERAKLLAEKQRAELKQHEAEVKQLKAEFEKQLAQTEMVALRSQMNPHFIFNCLNSIKLYTMQNHTEAATDYLSKFSRLIRLVLENSRNASISIASELEALCLYLDMEVMRFKQKLNYTVIVTPGLDMEYLEIPPLLLQPYVENAIWHGLMQREEGGHITINIAMQHDAVLVISITDNGIGRARAAELQSKTATRKKSLGTKVTSDRIALVNKLYYTATTVSIRDLTDSEGGPAGTEVTIKIPLHDTATNSYP